MKHIRRITTARPATADIIQDVVCQVSLAFAALLGEKGGESPILDFINNKCDIPGEDV